MNKLLKYTFMLLCCFLLMGCLPLDKETDKKSIVCTTYAQYNWLQEIIGENNSTFELTLLIKDGADLHSYQPTIQDLAKVSSADLFVYVGGESEQWVSDALKEAKNKNMLVVDMMDVLKERIKEEEHVEGMKEDHDENEDESEYDEHVWLSLINAHEVVRYLSNEVQKLDDVHKKTYEENNAKLYMVGVPIGNYDDMSYRAVETLKNVDIIFCEDTRVTLKLLTYFNISKPLKSYHTFNENEITDILINYIEEGKNVAVVSDAGMPIISDPGYVAVFEAIKRSIDVVVIPGPSAFVSALVGSGISSRKIYFVGFLNSNDNKRKKELEKLKDLEETLIMYESPHRIRETLEMISELMPTRNICLARELTKKYEEYLHGTASEILEVIDEIKGEIVLIIDGATTKEIKSDLISLSVQDHMNHYLEQGMDEKEAMKSVAKDRGVSKSIIYQQIKRK